MQGSETNHDEEVRQIAFRLWQEAGCPNGSDLQHRLKAKEIWLETHRSEKPTKPSKARKPRQTRTAKREL